MQLNKIFTKDLYTLGVLTLITIIAWMLYEIYGIGRSKILDPKYYELTKPIDPELNIEFIKSFSEKLPY